MRRHDDHDHDDHGGLHRDLVATGALIDAAGCCAWLPASARALARCSWSAAAATVRPRPAPRRRRRTRPRRRRPPRPRPVRMPAAGFPRRRPAPIRATARTGRPCSSASGVVRSDIRSSFAGLSGTAAGVPLNIVLTIVSASTCAPLAGCAVYLWHCDREGRYSLYTHGVTNQNYLRGVQQADATAASASPRSIPACYAGRGRTSISRCSRALPAAATWRTSRHVADRAAQGHQRPGLRHRRVRASVRNAAQSARQRQRLQRRVVARTGDDERRRGRGSHGDADGGGVTTAAHGRAAGSSSRRRALAAEVGCNRNDIHARHGRTISIN